MIVFVCFEGFIHASCVLVLYTVDQIYHLASPASPPNYMYNPIKVTQKSIHKLYHNGFVCGNLLWWMIIMLMVIMYNISIAQISIWIWSNALYNSRGNQINIAQITILQLLFITANYYSQIKCWFLMRGGNRSTRRKTSHSRVENQQTQSTFDAECGNRTQATLVEGKCSHH